MPELTNSTREAARRIGVSDTAMHKAERAGRIAREPNGQWDIDKTRRRLTETADPTRSPLAARESAEGTPFARLKVAQLALKVEAQRLSLDETKRRLLDVTEANAALDEIGSTMRDALLNWPARVAVPFIVVEGLRSKERQAKLVQAGASRTMNSRHITGHAVDLAYWLDDGDGVPGSGEVRWDWPLARQLAAAMKASAEAEGVALVWGGDWPSFPDGPHFELDRRSYP